MDEARTMGRLRLRYQGAQDAVDAALRRAGYKPETLAALPEDVRPGSQLEEAIARLREADELLTAAEQRSPARR
jgi:hypothetical protein